jgi:hypothetical protein
MVSRSGTGGSGSGPLSFLASVYNLDTLDTRFTTPSSVPYRAPNGKREDEAKPDKRAEPSKWGTAEFYVYYLVFLTAVPYMFWIAYDVSRRTYIVPGYIRGELGATGVLTKLQLRSDGPEIFQV